MRALVVTWAPGGNLPPLLAAASVLARRGHEVAFLASGPTRSAAERRGFQVWRYRRSPDPETRIAFEAQADRVMAAVVGHGGLSTVLRALAHGVPQLLLPLGRDQAFNASRVEHLGAGIALPPDAPAERIRAAVQALVAQRRFRTAAVAAADRIATDEPDRTAAEALERAARPDQR